MLFDVIPALEWIEHLRDEALISTYVGSVGSLTSFEIQFRARCSLIGARKSENRAVAENIGA